MIRLPKRYKDVFMQVDNRGNWLYGLVVKGNNIVSLYPMQENVSYVVLPALKKLPANLDRLDISESFKNQEELDYVHGEIVLSDYAFKGIKKCKIVLPQDVSVRIESAAFDADAEVEFILPENFELKTMTQFKQTYGNPSFPRHYALIADKNLMVRTFGNPWYESNEFNSDTIHAKCSVSKKFCVKDGDLKVYDDKISNIDPIIE